MLLTIGFSKAKSPLAIGSKLIQLVEKRPFSHVFISHEHPVTNIKIVTQASHGMVHQINLDLFKEKNEIVKQYEFNVVNGKDYLVFLHQNLGKPYSRLQLVWIGIKKLIGIKVKANNNDGAYICSEFVTRLLETLEIVNTIDEDYITPSDLERLLDALR